MTDQEIKDYIIQEINARLTKKRIPELVENPAPLSNADCLALWSASDNKTYKQELADLLTFFSLGGDGTGTAGDSAAKGKYTFDVSAAQAGTDTISLPQFAGKNAALTIDGRDYLDSEYDFLNAGGVKMNLTGWKFQEGMRVTLTFAEPLAGGTSTATSGGFIAGTVTVNTSTSLTSADAKKLIQLRGGATALTLTLPDVASLTDNDFLLVEALISNQKQQAVKTQGGQLIYLNSTSKTALYLAPGEVVALYRKPDGWYVINFFGKVYEEVGRVFADWTQATGNELDLNGQEVNRADYPRLWEKVQSMGAALVSKTLWQTASTITTAGQTVEYPNRGKFHTGDGTTTFGLPDFRGMTVRGLLAGTDNERTSNTAGNYQKNALEQHYHKTTISPNSNSDTGSGKAAVGGDANEGTAPVYISDGVAGAGGTTKYASATETRMDNIGMYWKIKV